MLGKAYKRSLWSVVTALLVVILLFSSFAFPQVYAQLRKETELTISPKTFRIASGQNITLTAKLTSGGQPLAGKQIVFAASLGSVNPKNATTDENGIASTVYTAPKLSVRTNVTVLASFLGDLTYKGSTATCQGVIEVELPSVSISGASFTVPETLRDEISSYRRSISEDILELLPIELSAEAFILATPESLYLVFADEVDSGLAYVEGWKILQDINLGGRSLGVVVAKSVAFEKEGAPATIGEILANPDGYKFKLVKVSANRTQVSMLYDPDEEPHVEFPITIGYLVEEEEKPLDIIREALERARDLALKPDKQLVKDLLQTREEKRLWLFNFNYEYWYDGPAITNGIVISVEHPIFELIEESMPVIGGFIPLEEGVVLYDVKTDIPYDNVSSIRELKANYDKYLGKTVRLEANCYGGYVSAQEIIEENTPCSRDYVYIEDVGCVNVVVDVRLEGLVAWNEVTVPPEREELLLVTGVSSHHQDMQFVNASGVFELIGKVVSTRQISDSLPEGIALVLCQAKKINKIAFEELAQQVKDEVRNRVGELYWTLQNIYPYATKPEIPVKIPRRVVKPVAPIFVREPEEIPEICVERNFTICMCVVRSESPIKLNITNSHITNISIALKETHWNITIYFENLPSRPPDVPKPSGLVYAYHEINVSVSREALKEANITFWVSKEWLITNEATANDVIMLRYYGGEWEELLTRCVSENATHLKFVAETPGFSVFAIVARETAPPTVTTGVEGYVRDETGNPIGGANVIALSELATLGKVSEAKSDEMGHYFMELPPGEYILVFSAPEYVDMSVNVSLTLDEVSRVDVNLTQAKAEFSENWYGVKFEVALSTEEPWRVGDETSVEVWITVNDVGDNQRVEFRQLKISLWGTTIEKTIPLNVETDIGGTVYSENISLRVLDGFELMAPETSKSYTLGVDLEGSVIDNLGVTWPSITAESTSIKVSTPPSPVSLSIELPTKVLIEEEFDIKVKVKNEGEQPVRDVEIKLQLPPVGISATESLEWSKSALNPAEEATATFRLRANFATTATLSASLSHKTLWGYSIVELKTLGSVTISKLPTSISISVAPTKVAVGEKVIVSGSIEPVMSAPLKLTIMEPDGTTSSLYGTSAPNGTFGFDVTLTKKGRYFFVVSYEGDLTYEASVSNEVYAEAEEKRACIIATVAYGSELDPHVQFLRDFRDNFALKTFAGSNFMEVFHAWYYSFSPSVASFISTSESLKAVSRVALYPLIGILHLGTLISDIFSFNSEVSVIAAGVVISALIGLVYFMPLSLLAIYFVGRWRGLPKLGAKALLMPWVVSALLVVVAELTPSPVLMKIGSGALVLSTIALTAWFIALKVATRLLVYYGSKP